MKKIMQKISVVLLFFLVFNIDSLSIEIQKLNNIIYSNEINVSQINLSDFLLYLSKEGNIEIVPENSIKEKVIDFYCKENSSLEKILSILTKSYDLQAKKENGYIFVLPRVVSKEGRGDIIGQVVSEDYNYNLSGAKITLLDGTSSPCYTDIKGRFKFENIPYGIFFLRAEKKEYQVEGEMLEVKKGNNYIKIFMTKKNNTPTKNLLPKEEKSNNFVIEKVKISDIENIDENLLDEHLKQGIHFAKNKEKGLLYLSGEEKKVAKIKEIFEKLDNYNKQVQITAQIFDVTENLFEELGFSWLYDKQSDNGFKIGILDSSEVLKSGSLLSSTINAVKNFKNKDEFLQVSFDMLQNMQDLKISAMPSIVTTNGKNGLFRITEERIIGEEKTENNDSKKTTYSPIFREAGIILDVTPEILSDNSIILKIILETSDFKVQPNIRSDYRDSKVSRNLETTVKIKDGDTIFIGGLKKIRILNSENSVPFISTVPVLGHLFKNNSTKNEVTDLYIRLKINILKDNNTFSKI